MLAAFLEGTRDIQLKDVDVPQYDTRSILVRVKGTAICGSDIKRYRATEKSRFRKYILGHETTGVVVEKGEAVTKFEIGERIVVQPLLSCGNCQRCYVGKDNLCSSGGMRGAAADGGFAEYIAVDEKDAYRLPQTIDFDEGTQIQTFATVCHGQRRLQPEPGKSMLIIGLGAAGLLHLQMAKIAGAMPIVVVDPFQWKLELAQTLGADVAIDASGNNALEQIKEATGGTGPDAVIEAVGIPATVALGIETVAPGGKVLMFGTVRSPMTGFDPFQIYLKEISLIGTRSAARSDWQNAIKFIEKGRIVLKPLVTHHISLSDIRKGFELMDQGTEGVIRIVVSSEKH